MGPADPVTGDLREDLLACGRAYLQSEGRNAQVLASVLSACRHDPKLRDAAQKALGAPDGSRFENVLSRAVERGLVRRDLDVETLAQAFPAIAYQQVAAQGRLITDYERPPCGLGHPAPRTRHHTYVRRYLADRPRSRPRARQHQVTLDDLVGAPATGDLRHEGDEWLYVLTGQLRLARGHA